MASIRLGRLVYIKVDLNNVGGSGASWTSIPQQTDGKLDIKSDRIDTTVKGDVGWTKELPVSKSWGLSCEGKCDPGDSTYQYLWNASLNDTKIWVQVDRSGIGGTKYETQAYVAVSENYPLKDSVSFTCDFACQGAPVVSVV